MGNERRPSRLPASRAGAPRKPTTRVPQRGTSRVSLAIPQKKNNTPLIVGGAAGGAVLLIIIIAFASASGGTSSPRETSNPQAPKPVDVSAIETEGLRKCDEGLAVIQSCGSLMEKLELTPGEHQELKTKLTRGEMLLNQGLRKLDEANTKTQGQAKYDVRLYTQARLNARKKLLGMK